jgi:hypothetical protein
VPDTNGQLTPEQIDNLFHSPLPRPLRYEMRAAKTPAGPAVVMILETPEMTANYVTSPEEAIGLAEAIIQQAQIAQTAAGQLLLARDVPPPPRVERP